VPSRRLCAALAVSAVLLTACGGPDPVPSGPLPSIPSTGDATAPTSAPTMAGVKIRLVNLYLPAEGEPEQVDVYSGLAIGDVQGEPIHTLELGEVTEYFEPPASTPDGEEAALAFFPEGKRAVDDKLIQFTQTMKQGDQWTVVLNRALTSDGTPSMGFQNLNDVTAGDPGQMNVPGPPAGKGQIIGYANALTDVLGQDDNSFNYGIPGKGCLEGPEEANLDVNVGGTAAVPFDLEPGTVQVAAYDAVDVECSGKPELEPVEVEVVEGKRTYVMVFTRSEDPADREFLVVPTE
jgi:hypothetical protein